jgi:hypothetical protein
MQQHQFYRTPAELRALRQWIVWRYEGIPGVKPTKVPYNARGRWKASVTQPNTWSSFDEAVKAYEQSNGELNGIGFVFTRDDPYAGIDLDATDNEEWRARQQKIYEAFNSYSERSPSGHGLHIIIRANVATGRKREAVELYSNERFFTFTGDVFNDTQIVNQQALATILYEELGAVKDYSNYQGEIEERYTDDQIITQALQAVNGEKFKALHDGRWQDLYGSQSEADFAYIDIIAFYSRVRTQIVRIFRNSPLGQRDKAQRSAYVGYMLNKCFDKMLPLVDIEGLSIRAHEFKTTETPITIIQSTQEDSSPYTPPPGLLGDIARYIFAQAPRPVPEIALAGAIAFLAGIVGRSYNVSETGLNQYVLCLAPTGTGKEAMARGIDRLIAAIQEQIPAAREFVGPADYASGPALIKHLNKSPCTMSLVGEFGLRMQQMASMHANGADVSLRRVMLDLYNKSGYGNVMRASKYSNKENDTNAVFSPAFTLLGESTPETFLASIDETVIASGLLPRFTLIEYHGQRVPLSKTFLQAVIPDQLRANLVTLAEHSLRMQHLMNGSMQITHVQIAPDAQAIINEYDEYADTKINQTHSDVTRQLWNRAHVKLLKLSALVAVGINFVHPTITVECVEWAKRLVTQDIVKLGERFAQGEVGNNNSEREQAKAAMRIVQEYVQRPYEEITGVIGSQQMHFEGVIAHAYLTSRLRRLAVFEKDRVGASNAVARTLKALLEDELLVEISKTQMQDRYSIAQRAYIMKT